MSYDVAQCSTVKFGVFSNKISPTVTIIAIFSEFGRRPIKVGRGGRVGRAQVSKSRCPGFNPTDAVSNLGHVRLPHVALV